MRLPTVVDPRRWKASALSLLILICCVGLTLRLIPALEHGYQFDIETNEGWALSAAKLGLAHSYVQQLDGNVLPNYPPFGMVIFEAVGSVFLLLHRLLPHVNADALFLLLIKLPAMLADIATAVVLFFVVRRMQGKALGLVAALLYVLHPIAWYDSAFWGQVDAIFTLFLLASLLLLTLDRPMSAGMLLALSLLTKVQGVFLLPLFALLVLRKPRSILRFVLGGLLMIALVLIPFHDAISLNIIKNIYLDSVGYYAVITSGAFNFWYAILGDPSGSMSDTTLLFNIASYRFFGFVLYGVSVVVILDGLLPHLRGNRGISERLVATLVAASLLSLAFFLFSTEMHERYFFPFIVFGFPLLFVSLRTRLLYVTICCCFFLNLLSSMPATDFDATLFQTLTGLRTFLATGQCFLFLSLLSTSLSTRAFVRTT